MSLGSGRLRRRARTGLLAEPICAVGHGVAALCCATSEDRSWVFQGYSVTGVSARTGGALGGAAVVGPARGRGLAAGVPRAPLSGWLLAGPGVGLGGLL